MKFNLNYRSYTEEELCSRLERIVRQDRRVTAAVIEFQIFSTPVEGVLAYAPGCENIPVDAQKKLGLKLVKFLTIVLRRSLTLVETDRLATKAIV